MPQSIKDIMAAPIPLSVVMFLIVQTMGFVWWVSVHVNQINLSLASLQDKTTHIQEIQTYRAGFEARIVILEQNDVRTREDISEIKETIHLNGNGGK